MAILDKLKRKRRPDQKEAPKKKTEEKPTKTDGPQVPKKSQAVQDLSGRAYRFLLQPHVTEKASFLGQQGKYVFNVSQRAKKIEIRRAVESLYKVNVVSVNVVKTARKPRRLGRTQGFKKGTKKAIVSLKKGQTIDVFSV